MVPRTRETLCCMGTHISDGKDSCIGSRLLRNGSQVSLPYKWRDLGHFLIVNCDLSRWKEGGR